MHAADRGHDSGTSRSGDQSTRKAWIGGVLAIAGVMLLFASRSPGVAAISPFLSVASGGLLLGASGAISQALSKIADRSGGLVARLASGFCAVGALVSAWLGLRTMPATEQSQPALTGAAAALLATLAVLTIYAERRASLGNGTKAGGADCALLRIGAAAVLVAMAAILLRALGIFWASWLSVLFAVPLAFVAFEILVRAVAALFLPASTRAGSPVRSTVATWLSAPRGWWRAMKPGAGSGNLAPQLGLELAQSWSLGFLRRASLPVLIALGALAWLLSGIIALGANERAIEERLGVPVAVLGPGLHVGPPWPFSTFRKLEYGVVHDIAVLAPASDQDSSASAAPLAADAVPPPEADRLWDRSHATEASFLVAGQARGRQVFEVVDIDLRIVYRVGLSEQAALVFAYSVADPVALLRAAAGELLAKSFASATLLGVIGEDRAAFVGRFETALRDRLASLGSGLDILAAIIEGIHPPPSAAAAYHEVQAASVRANTSIADQQAAAVRTRYQAQQKAVIDHDAATALARETVGDATRAATLFAADREGLQIGGAAYLMERRFDRLRKALVRSQLVIVDHRLAGDDAPTLDMRLLAPPSSPPP